MRSVHVYLRETTQDVVAAVLDLAYPGQRFPWLHLIKDDPYLYIDFLPSNWSDIDPDHWKEFQEQFGGEPAVAVTADVSGRHPGGPQVLEFVTLLLSKFNGLANDDYTDRLWPLSEIIEKARYKGFEFFDWRAAMQPD
jgi:hypothetical protein